MLSRREGSNTGPEGRDRQGEVANNRWHRSVWLTEHRRPATLHRKLFLVIKRGLHIIQRNAGVKVSNERFSGWELDGIEQPLPPARTCKLEGHQ